LSPKSESSLLSFEDILERDASLRIGTYPDRRWGSRENAVIMAASLVLLLTVRDYREPES
jgi:hypothetical protein